MRSFEWASTNDNETNENIVAVITLGSKGNDDLSRGTHNDDGIKRERMEFSRVNIYLNDLGNKSNRSGVFVDPELVPNPSLYSPANVKYNVVENYRLADSLFIFDKRMLSLSSYLSVHVH